MSRPRHVEAGPPCITQHELARRWRLSVGTLERWRARGTGPAWLMIGGSVRYLREDVEAFEMARRQTPAR